MPEWLYARSRAIVSRKPSHILLLYTGIFSLSLSISISVSLSLSISRLLTESAKASSRTRELLPRGGYSFVEPRKKKDPSLSTRAAETCHPSRDSFFFPPFVFFLPFYTTVRLISDPVFLERDGERERNWEREKSWQVDDYERTMEIWFLNRWELNFRNGLFRGTRNLKSLDKSFSFFLRKHILIKNYFDLLREKRHVCFTTFE